MKILIEKKIENNLYKIIIKTQPTEIEKNLFSVYGEPLINIREDDNFKDFKKIFSDCPIILIGEDVNINVLKNNIISKIKDAIITLKAKSDTFSGDELLEI